MPHSPRHWLQFRLSTWFVLIGILAWGVTARPWIVPTVAFSGYRRKHEVYPDLRAGSQFVAVVTETYTLNPALLGPTLALAAFVGWKAAWAIGRRVKARKDEQPECQSEAS